MDSSSNFQDAEATSRRAIIVVMVLVSFVDRISVKIEQRVKSGLQGVEPSVVHQFLQYNSTTLHDRKTAQIVHVLELATWEPSSTWKQSLSSSSSVNNIEKRDQTSLRMWQTLFRMLRSASSAHRTHICDHYGAEF